MKKAALVLAIASAAALRAAPAAPSPAAPRPISGDSPLPAGCSHAGAAIDSEVEPMVAVNPTDPGNMIAVWQQDRFFGGGARADVAAYTTDGGATWTRVVPGALSDCSDGGPFPRSTDPWVAFGPDGRAYFLIESHTGTVAPLVYGPAALLVVTSVDGGATWSAPAPVVADAGGTFSDKGSITADPYQAGRAYVAWLRFPGDAGFFSRTDDGGRTWLPPVPLPLVGQGHVIAVLPDRTLVMVANAGGGTIQAIRSSDGGLTWSLPATVGDGRSRNPNAAGIRDFNLPSIAVGPDGVLYVAWEDDLAIALGRSTDRGRVWSVARVTATDVLAFTPTVAVTSDGVVGVMYHDLRGWERRGDPLDTDVWLTASPGGLGPWTEQHLSGPFDMVNAPETSTGLFVGDYAGLGVAGTLLVPVFARPVSKTRVLTDVLAGVVDP